MRLILLFFLCCAHMVVASGEDLPVEYFFRDPTFRTARLSPEGTHLAILVRVEGVMSLAVLDLATNQPRVVAREGFDITRYYWANNERLIYMSESARDREAGLVGGIFAVNRDGKRAKVLVIPPYGDDRRVSYNAPTTEYLGRLPDDPDGILVTFNDRSRRHPDVYRMDVRTGRTKRVLLNTQDFRWFNLDVDGHVRFGFRKAVEEDEVHVSLLNPDTEEWEHFITLPNSGTEWSPIDFSPAHDTFLVQTDLKEDRVLLMRYNWRDGTTEVAYSDDSYDLSDLSTIRDFKSRDRSVGIYYEADKPRHAFFDPQYERLQQMIDSALPNTFNQIVNLSESGEKVLVMGASDRQMPHYYLLDLKAGKIDPLDSIAPWISPEDLVETRPIRFTASDGETVHGYLTLPANWREGEPAPLIVNPHGGPWARDTWRLQWYFDLERQFYAARGFAVLQVNFRGSTGFGRAFSQGHIKNIGRMYDDMIEGIEWAADKGYVDRDKVGIAGASWGGYKTMLALTRDPERFRFGINLFGVVDIPEQLHTYLTTWDRKEAYEWWRRRIGDPSVPEELAYLNEWSPIHAIERIQSPVFIYHGLRDLNVDIEQSRMLISALRRAGKEFKHILDTEEMHSMEDEKLRLRVYREIDAFLLPFREKWGLLESTDG